MREIQGNARTVRELLKSQKYEIDYYQREYRWAEKQIHELLDDLVGKFIDDYQPEHERKQVRQYGHYFLGSIIISKKDNGNYIVDGQQRLTTLTLLLIYLRNCQGDRSDKVHVDDLIYSEQYGEKSFNLHVPDRMPCMEALFAQQAFDPNGHDESVRNLVDRYNDISSYFPEDLIGHALPYFLDWLLENVHLVEVTAYSDDDAYTIFETMNDRGLSLTPTEMLKGYLLVNITNPAKRVQANDLWRDQVQALNGLGKDVEPDALKAWLRSRYANKIRERRKGAKPEDFDLLGTEFHRWVRDHSNDIGLNSSERFFDFIYRDFNFYSRWYMRLIAAARRLTPGLEAVLYNAHHGFTLQYMLLLAPLRTNDTDDVARRKVNLVARYLDILLAWRLWNSRSIAYSNMQYAMFVAMREIRGLELIPLAKRLHDLLAAESETFAANNGLYLHQQNRYYLHRILARLTDYVETASGQPSCYEAMVADSPRFEVEHIWANKPEQHREEFPHPNDFRAYRNRVGGLLLLPKKFNASYGALPYMEKLPHYNTQNLLARSLHPQCYDHNPGFVAFVTKSGLPFHPHTAFTKADLDERGELYRRIAEQVWNPDSLLKEVGL